MITLDSSIVAIARMGTSIEDESRALAADLGTLAYEERLKLAAGVPAIVLVTAEVGRADTLAGRLRARGHVVQACRSSDVVPASAMTSMRRFHFADDAIVAGDARLPWREISVLIRAPLRRRIETTETVKSKQLDLGRAIATGGLMMRKSVKREVITRSEDTEPVLYIFRGLGEPAWILHEQGTHFGALGGELTPISSRNFVLTVERLRTRAPHARYDDRLVARKPALEDLDLLAHLIATAP